MSVTKSFFGTIGAMLVVEAVLDAEAPVAKYIPELKDTGFGDATIRQILDMTTGIKYTENYADPKAGQACCVGPIGVTADAFPVGTRIAPRAIRLQVPRPF